MSENSIAQFLHEIRRWSETVREGAPLQAIEPGPVVVGRGDGQPTAPIIGAQDAIALPQGVEQPEQGVAVETPRNVLPGGAPCLSDGVIKAIVTTAR